MGTVEHYDTTEGRRYRVRYRTPDRRQTSKRGFKTKRAAEEFLAGVEVSKVRGEWRDPSRARISVRALADEWIAAQVQLKPTTLSGYRYSLEAHVLPRWGDWRLADITHGQVQTWVNELTTAGKAPSTVRQIQLVLARMLKYAVRDGRIATNPCDDVQLPRLRKQERGYLTHEQVARLAVECGERGDVVRFLAYTGLRWGEMAALRVDRLDMLRRRVSVVESVSEVGGRLEWGTPKSHESRSVPFPRLLEQDLARRCEGKGPGDLVFGTGEVALRNNNFRRRVWAPALVALQERDPTFPDVTPHDLRHTAASLAIAAGANVKAVQRMLGHASAAMTLDVYADLFDDDLDAVAAALDQHASAALVAKMWPRAAGDVAELPQK